jgi:hypothetical protein
MLTSVIAVVVEASLERGALPDNALIGHMLR